MRLPTFLLLFVLASGAAARAPEAQTLPPGEGFEWEPVGSPPLEAFSLAFAPDGALWAGGADNVHTPGNHRHNAATNTWEPRTSQRTYARRLTFLSPDTLLILDSRNVLRSTDGGSSWRGQYLYGSRSVLHVVPFGLPHSGGRVITSVRESRGGGLAYSLDRGLTFTEGTYDPALFGTSDIRASAVTSLARGPHAGRLVQGGLHGVALSDDGGATWRPSTFWTINRYWVNNLGTVDGPDGEPRLLAAFDDFALPNDWVAYSSDGGETWHEFVPLPDAPDGGVANGFGRFVSLALIGLPRSALAILGQGYIYRTDDSAETWTLVGEAPTPYSITWVQEALLDAEGRLLIAAPGNGNTQRGGVFRTAQPVAVTQEASPPEASGASLRITPNPSSGAAQIRLSLPSPEAVTVAVFDARGREMWRGASGARGEHAVEVDTSGWAAGVYVVRAEAGGEVAHARLTVAR